MSNASLNKPQPSDEAESRAALRRYIYAAMIVVGAAGIVGRILSIEAVDHRKLDQPQDASIQYYRQTRTPFLSANDRSRWLTVRSLVELGTYEIDKLIVEPYWETIDLVKHDDEGRAAPRAGEGHYYSSKPPLLATLIAGEYWLIYRFTGYSLGEHPFGVGRFMLITINVPTIIVMWWLIARHAERYGRTDFARVFVVAAAVFGTMLTTFAVALNNHLIAAASAMVLLDAIVRIAVEGDRRWFRFAQAGFFAAFLAVNELPALSVAGLAALGLLWKFPKPTLAFAGPAAAIVAAAALGTNYAAHGTVFPAYGHRQEGNNWYLYEFPDRHGNMRQSYWSPETMAKRGAVDRGESSRRAYALHVLVGHHGIFSLTPMWLLSVVGLSIICLRRGEPLRAVGLATAAATLVCLAFYLTRPLIDRNYGGTVCGFRWVFWFAPLWLAAMLPAVDICAKHWTGRAWCLLLLAGSIVSVTYPTWNPWSLPWLTELYEYMEWAKLSEH